MEKNNNAVEGTPAAAPVGGVQANVIPTPGEQDYVAELARKDAEILKTRVERDNYKQGLLKAKGKIAGGEEVDNIDLMRQIAKEEALSAMEERLVADKDAIITKALKENSELKLALKNKGGTPPASIGTHSEGIPVQDGQVTSEQIAALKAKGWDDKKIDAYKKNLRKKI